MSAGGDFGESNPRSDQLLGLTGLDSAKFENYLCYDPPRTELDRAEYVQMKRFEELLEGLLGGDILLTDSNVLQLLRLNDYLELQFNDVGKKCLEYTKARFLQSVPISNALDLLRIARSKGEDDALVHNFLAHICGHLHHFSKDALLMEMSFENLKALLVYSRDYILDLPGSSDVLLAIIHNWVNCNRAERSKHRCQLMGSINFSNVSSDFSLSLIMRLENVADEATCCKYVQSIPELSTLKTGIDLGDIGGNARLNGQITLKVNDIIKRQSGWKEYSSHCIISNLSWKLCAKKEEDDGAVCIGLWCDGSNLTGKWNCYASAALTIKSPKKGRKDFESETASGYFSSETPNYVLWIGNLQFDFLIDRKNRFLENGSITFNALVQAEVPFAG